MSEKFDELVNIISRLRAPDGCKWDREQTHTSLKQNFIEETYEALDAIDANDMKHLKEELGDVLLQVVLHAQIAKEEGAFDIDDVAQGISEKLVHRHPHVFGDVKVNSTQEILDNWEKLKKEEKPHRTSIMDGISRSLPALFAAYKISKKAIKVGFEWPNVESLYDCFYSEIEEFKQAVKNGTTWVNLYEYPEMYMFVDGVKKPLWDEFPDQQPY
jgi:tetrapyrrole methylase family protein/MazG family protein